MNRQKLDVLNAIYNLKTYNQREIAQLSGHSLGIVNRSIKQLLEEGYLKEDFSITEKGTHIFREAKPKNSVILAAGYGMRMVPINMEVPKGLLEVDGEPLVERLIKQLHEVGVTEIYVVVGFLKEQYEYLIDEYNVRLITNAEYAEKNNLYSLKKVERCLGNTYIIPCDLWCFSNPFNQYELYSWYMVNEIIDEDSNVRVNRKLDLVETNGSGNTMVGLAYIENNDAAYIRNRLEVLTKDKKMDDAFWEECLWDGDKMITQAKVVPSNLVIEIDTFEQLRELDEHSSHLQSEAIDIIAEALHTTADKIKDITVLKKGMTNRSFLFQCNNKKYIMRIPGEGTDQLINRREEAEVYNTIASKAICDNIMYINPENGYKITEYIEGARVCDLDNQEDLMKAMKKLREFHGLKLKVNHEFDIFRQIEFYESLWKGTSSVYRDYVKTKRNVLSLQEYINQHVEEKVLTHIDAVPDNFLFTINENGKEEIRLIDWEYAGMQDPHVDIAMFCIYAMYEREQVDNLIDTYFEGECSREIRVKIYAYIAACGLLWSNWCEYKRQLGVEFGEYSLKQYRYAKEYYRLVQSELSEMEE